MVEVLKRLKWDLQNPIGRFVWAYFFLRNLPGGFGKELRKRFLKKHLQSVGRNLIVHEGVYIRNIDKLVIGDNVGLGTNNFIQAAGGVTIGNDVLLGPDVKIWSANHVFKDADRPVRGQGYDLKKVIIGNNVWVGANTFIMPGANIGDGVIISAGSIVGGKNYPPYSVLAGNPARKIGARGHKSA